MPRADFDSPWKDALEEYLEECFLLLFPEAHAAIDWSRPYTFLDTELRQADPDGELGPRRVDKLVRVWLLDGQDAWILVHVEVQSQEDHAFTQRMFLYFARIFDHFNREVVSMAVLADERLGWRPETFSMGRWGFSVRVRFPVVKLAEWRLRIEELEESSNPFATVVLAHLAAQDTRGDVWSRQRAKLGLVRRLYQRGYTRERIVSLFRFIDWLLALPHEAELAFRQQVRDIEEDGQMPYITSIERIGRAEGREEGREEGKRGAARVVIAARFGTVSDALSARIDAASESELDALLVRAAVVAALEDL